MTLRIPTKPARRLLTPLVVLCCLSPTLAAQTVDYVKSIKPILTEKCYSCHGVIKQEAGLRLDTTPLMLQGGDSGAAIVEGKPAKSLILHRISADAEQRMPPAESGSPLRADQIALIAAWIKQGASAPNEKTPAGPKDHWAFKRIEKPIVPATQPKLSNPIDAFLQEQRTSSSLTTNQPVERSILLRRLYLDLVGLPPTLQQLSDDRPYKTIVDELLASPQHGERYGRHWMDIWRYSDWYGLGAQLRNSQKHIWHWRDWIIESLNADKGYDRMIHEMLAADEIAPTDLQTLRATGFLARNYYLFNRTTWLDDTIEHTGKAFLGLTLNCAKCHDHKYDPLTHVDYYNFRAIFEPHQVRLDPVPGESNFEQDGIPRVFDDHLQLETRLHLRGDPKTPDAETKISAAVPALFSKFAIPAKQIELPEFAWNPGSRKYVKADRLAAIQTQLAAAQKQLDAANDRLAATGLNKSKKPPATEALKLQITDNFDQPRPGLWELVGDGWKYKDGKLVQTKSTRERQVVRLKQKLPKDFDVSCRYNTTGGDTYKSVTFRFDDSANGQYDNFVYTSAHAGGPKIQAAFTRKGTTSYPPLGRKAHPIQVGREYELRFAVRDRLVNVWLDGEFALAFQFPDRRPSGDFTISGFDATVAFDSISIRSLPANVELKGSHGPHEVDAQSAFEIAQARVHALQRQDSSLQQQFEINKSTTAEQLKLIAIHQAEAAIAMAEYDLLAAGSDNAKTKTAKAEKQTAQKRLADIKAGKVGLQPIRASKKALETPAHKEADYPATYSKFSTGRRLALAKWITSRDNPLTARVAVNHVWMRHFGTPLVESVFDFGLRAKQPTHHRLLDYLAAEFMTSGWSFKHLHRLIVTSNVYQLSSVSDGDSHGVDPTNKYYWRMNSRRMESQVVRDSLLHLAGQLDLTFGGPSLDVGKGNRRSLYFKHSRDQQDKFLSMFDDADLLRCYRRSESVVPQQALALANSKLPIQMAEKIAERIQKQFTSKTADTTIDEFITTAFQVILARRPDAAEHAECIRFTDQLAKLIKDTDPQQQAKRIRERLIHALLNHNDFISIR